MSTLGRCRDTVDVMSHVFGDATPFPYDIDYIELSRHAVDCAVQLLSARHAIATACERAETCGPARNGARARLTAMSAALVTSLEPFSGSASAQTERISLRLRECLDSTVDAELATIDRQAADESAQTHNIVTRSGESARRALETFLLRHDLPGTELALTWASAGERGYTAHVSLKTPFGIQAIFSIAIASDHVWSRSRRLAELEPGLEVHFPQQAGWISKRVEMAPVKLDRLYLSAFRLDTASAEFRLRKGANSGSGYRVVVDLNGPHQALIQPLVEDGSPDTDAPLALDPQDSAQMFRLCKRVLDSTRNLFNSRQSMVSVELDAEPLDDVTWSQIVAERLLEQLAPMVNEIARRSGAPAELVLRRDMGGGRREELYVTKAELYEKILVLPPTRRGAFDKLGLRDRLAGSAPAHESKPATDFMAGVSVDVVADDEPVRAEDVTSRPKGRRLDTDHRPSRPSNRRQTAS
jgi:hypothetical protein